MKCSPVSGPTQLARSATNRRRAVSTDDHVRQDPRPSCRSGPCVVGIDQIQRFHRDVIRSGRQQLAHLSTLASRRRLSIGVSYPMPIDHPVDSSRVVHRKFTGCSLLRSTGQVLYGDNHQWNCGANDRNGGWRLWFMAGMTTPRGARSCYVDSRFAANRLDRPLTCSFAPQHPLMWGLRQDFSQKPVGNR